jgi:hypothetical protein
VIYPHFAIQFLILPLKANKPQTMQVTFHKQTQFTRHLKAGGRVREFNFLKLNNGSPSFEVDVADERGNRHMFILAYEDSWKIKGAGLPEWVSDLGEELYHQVSDTE